MNEVEIKLRVQNAIYWYWHKDKIMEDTLRCFGPECEKCCNKTTCMMWARI